jgi:membrane protein DedA with SNARE-associated domain
MHTVVDALSQWGYAAIVGLLLLEVIPSELVLAYGGYMVSLGTMSFWGAVACGTVGGVAAQVLLYAVGRFGGRPLCNRYGKWLLLSPRHIAQAEHWFGRYGTGFVLLARFVPVVRHAISLPAGFMRMPLWWFVFLTTVAIIPWSIGFVWLGMQLGRQWYRIETMVAQYAPAAIALFVVGVVVWIVLRGRFKKKAGPAAR